MIHMKQKMLDVVVLSPHFFIRLMGKKNHNMVLMLDSRFKIICIVTSKNINV